MITKDNYEIYFTDYLDGTLPPSKEAELKAFLLINPDLEAFLEDMDQVKLKAPEIIFGQKQLLKAICTDEWRDEGPRLMPDRHIHFEKKALLYKKSSSRILFFRISAVAALLILFITIGITFIKQPHTPELLTVQTTKITVEPVPVIPIKPAPIYAQPVNLPEKLHLQRDIQAERPEVAGIIPGKEIAVVSLESAPLTSHAVYVSSVSSPEIILNDKAREWKSSVNNFQSKDIFTSVFNAGKNLADKLKSNEVSDNKMK